MYKFLLIALIFCLNSHLSAEVFRVIEETEDHLLIEFTLPEYSFHQEEVESVIYQHILSPEAELMLEPGLPELPFYSGIAGLPINGNMICSIIQSETESISDINIFPAAKINYEDELPSYEFYRKDPDEITSGSYPASYITTGRSMFYKDRYLSSFLIYPYQYNTETRELDILLQATFRIDIRGDKRASQNSSYRQDENSVTSNLILNNTTSSRWRRSKPESEYTYQRNEGAIEQLQIIVGEEGIYRIGYEELQAALETSDQEEELNFEFDLEELDPNYLGLSNEFGPVPVYFYGEEDHSFDPGDYFEFYGEPHKGDVSYYDDYTSENTYLLKLNNSLGNRLAVENGGLENPDPDQYIVPVSFQQNVHLEEQNFIDFLGAQFNYNSYNYYREDIWFWSKISSPTLRVIPIELQYPEETTIRTFTAAITVFGSTYDPDYYNQPNHLASININSASINNISWGGQTEMVFQNLIPQQNSLLYHGENLVYINMPGLPGIPYDQILLDNIDITYWREYKTDEDRIKFTKPQNKPFGLFQFELDNFTGGDISVYKLGTSKMENVQITTDNDGILYKATFQDIISSENIMYYAVTETEKKLPLLIRPDTPSNLKDPANAADYLIITTTEFTQAEGTLLLEEIWEGKGYQVSIIDQQNIFDEFNFGIRSAEAIRDFLAYCYDNWSEPELTHVVLLGDGIMDERDSSADRDFNLVPFRRVWVEDRGAIASDNWMACIIGDDPVADVSIGRITVWQEDQILDVANKSLQYLEQPNYEDLWHSRLVLAAGGNPSEGNFFALQSERIRDLWIPDRFDVRRVYCNTNGLPDEYHGNTTTLISEINDGIGYLQFMGHGGGFVWADYNLLNKADISTFNNDNLPFVSSLSCYGSAFNGPRSSCIGEELILEAGKGAIGHIGFTGYGYKNADEVFGNYLTEAIYHRRLETLGDIVNFTKLKFFAAYGMSDIGIALIQGCAYLGDPMIPLTLSDEEVQVSLNSYNFSIGDTLVMSAEVEPDISGGKFIIYNENDSQLPLDEYYPFTLPVQNGTVTASDYVVSGGLDEIMNRSVKFFGFGSNREITGYSNFTVGTTAVVNIEIDPGEPTETDSINISADFFDEDGIQEITCFIENTHQLTMIQEQDNHYVLPSQIGPYEAGNEIDFRFKIVDNSGDSLTTDQYSFYVIGPDLMLQEAEVLYTTEGVVLRTQVSNVGETASGDCTINLYDIYDDHELITQINLSSLAVNEHERIDIPLPVLNGSYRFRLIVNELENNFSELNYSNNIITTETFTFNMFLTGAGVTEINSLDGNLNCVIPTGLFPENSLVFLNSKTYSEPVNQPDVDPVIISDSLLYNSFQFGVFNEEFLADSSGYFLNEGSITLQFDLSQADSTAHDYARIRVYREEDQYDKWLIRSGETDLTGNSISFNADRTGTYTVLKKLDDISPQIDVNVEGQEFTEEGFISATGTFSFVLSDANGIDIFSDNISMWLNGGLIDSDEFVISPTYGNLISLPVRFEIDLPSGEHNLTIECSDVNGNYNYKEILFETSDEFDIINIGNYPNPVKSLTSDPVNAGRTRFTYVLTDDADRVVLKVYTVSGRLVNTFRDLPASIGYHEYPRTYYGWECVDRKGFELANGVYFYTITAVKGNKKIEKTRKMAILK